MHKSTSRNVGITLLSSSQFFYQEMQKGILDEAAKSKDTAHIVFAEYEHGTQAEQVLDFVNKKMEAIVICSCDSDAIGDVIEAVNKVKIPVFTVDLGNSSGKGKVVSHITSDNEQGGKLAGRLLARAIGYEGKVGAITHPYVTAAEGRMSGLKKMLESFADVRYVIEKPGWSQKDKAKSAMKEILKEVPDIKGVFAINDDMALGALEVVEESGKKGQIKIVGYNGDPAVRGPISEGRIYADVRQHPFKLGQEVIKVVNEYFDGIKVPPILLVEVGTWT